MLKDAGQPALGLDPLWLAVAILALDRDRCVAGDRPKQAGDGQAGFHAVHLLFGDADDLRVDHLVQHAGLIPELLAGLLVIGQADHDHALADIDLRRGQANARCGQHGLRHIVQQFRQPGVKDGHPPRLASQDVSVLAAQNHNLTQCHARNSLYACPNPTRRRICL